MILNFPDVKQPDDYSCGAACSMAVGLYFNIGPKVLDEWKRILGTDVEKSTFPSAIVDYFRLLGLNVVDKQYMTVQELAYYVDNDTPVIVCVQDYGDNIAPGAEFDYGHYLVVIGVYENYIICQDPSEDNVIKGSGSVQEPGKIIIGLADFLEIWHDLDGNGKKYFHYGIAISK